MGQGCGRGPSTPSMCAAAQNRLTAICHHHASCPASIQLTCPSAIPTPTTTQQHKNAGPRAPQMRAVLPKEVPMKALINNCCQGGSLVGGSGCAGNFSLSSACDALVQRDSLYGMALAPPVHVGVRLLVGPRSAGPSPRTRIHLELALKTPSKRQLCTLPHATRKEQQPKLRTATHVGGGHFEWGCAAAGQCAGLGRHH